MNESDNVDGRVDRPRGRPPSRTGRRVSTGAVQAVLGQLDKGQGRHRRRTAARLQRAVRRRPADCGDPGRGVVNAAAGTDQPKLRPLLDLLPIGGRPGSGTLSNRYLDTERRPPRPPRDTCGPKTGSVDRNQFVGRASVTDASGRGAHVSRSSPTTPGPQDARLSMRWPPSCGRGGVQHMSPATKSRAHRQPRRRLAVRGDRRRQTRPVRARLPPSTPAARSIDQLAEASRNAELPVREVTGLNEGGEIPRGPHRRPRRMDPRPQRNPMRVE